MSPMVSILIPVFNLEHYLEETLMSILEQTYASWECILVDDGSTDRTGEIIEKYIAKDSRFKYFCRSETQKKGPNKCRNIGFEKSKGDWIVWFDGDDILKADFLEIKVKHISERIDVVVSKLEFYHPNDLSKNSQNVIYSKQLVRDYLVGDVSFYVCGGLWKRSFLEKQNELFDTSISNLDDWDFNLRMLYAQPEIEYVFDALVLYRIHENSLSHQIGKLNKQEIVSENKAREKHLELLKNDKPELYKVLRALILERQQFFYKKGMVSNSAHKFYFFKNLLEQKVKRVKLFGIAETLFGFMFYTIFKKGYKLLK